MEVLGMRDIERYPSTYAPPGKYIVIGYSVFGGTWLEGTYWSRDDARYRADGQNYHRKDTIDDYYIAYDSSGSIIRESSVFFPKRPGLALCL